MQRYFLISILTALFAHANAQSPNTPITGWKMQESNGQYTFTPITIFGSPDFRYDVYPIENNGADDLPAWLQSKAEKDQQSGGYTAVAGQSKAQDVKSFKILSILVKDRTGKNWLMNYMAYTLPDHSVRYGRIIEIPNAQLTKDKMNTAVQHFIKLSKQEGSLSNTTTTAKNSTNTKPQQAETPVTAPGQGIQPSQLKGVVLHQEYGFGVGGMMIIKYNPYLLLTDGTIYSHPYECAYDIDFAKSRQVEPKKWGTWKIEGKNLIVTMNEDHKADNWETRWFWAQPAKKGETMSGTWSTISGGGNTAIGGGSMVVSSNVLTFNDQGQFTTQSTGGGSYSGSTGSVSAYSSKDGAGTYTLDGFLLELKYNNGKVVRKNFAFYPDSKDVWVWGTSPYTTNDKKKK